jgi:hypothetical protein
VKHRRLTVALISCLLAGCTSDERGATVYYRTASLGDAQFDSLQLVIAEAPFRVKAVGGERIPHGPARGGIQLVRGSDDSVALDRLVTWLRRQPGIVAAGRDSATVFH